MKQKDIMYDLPEIILSGDGSHTIVSPTFNTSYHSTHGAITESNVVFINAGLNYLISQEYRAIQVFEMGFGTGLNALLTYLWADANNIKVDYHTIEAYPLDLTSIKNLNYGEILNCQDKYLEIHQLPWEFESSLSDNFTFTKYHAKIEDFDLKSTYDVVFYDAFAPANQPHLWDIPVLSKMYSTLNENGILVSFCAQGAFKRHLREIGFKVEGIPGPPGKREMTRAHKTLTKL